MTVIVRPMWVLEVSAITNRTPFIRLRRLASIDDLSENSIGSGNHFLKEQA
ncbi:hypothetical protein BH20ACT6_BH20ACT6_23690 [soil metagenome]